MLILDTTVHKTICILLFFKIYLYKIQSKSEFYSVNAE